MLRYLQKNKIFSRDGFLVSSYGHLGSTYDPVCPTQDYSFTGSHLVYNFHYLVEFLC